MLYLEIIIFFILAIILLRAVFNKADEDDRKPAEIAAFDKDVAILRFSELLKCETVEGKEEAFTEFYHKLEQLYPGIYRHCEYEQIGERALMYRLKGRDSSESIVLMSHYDVVPAHQEEWTHPPFSGEVSEGRIWGRGTLDTKGTFCGVMESVEYLISIGFVPRTDIYLCFGGDEETGGKGAKQIVAELKKRGVTPFLVLDEGGAVLDGSIVGIKQPCAVVGIAEKGYMDIELIARSKGGHTSLPPKSNPMVTISEAVIRLHRSPFRLKVCPPVKTMIRSAARYASFRYRLVLANYRIFRLFFKYYISKASPEIEALSRTTGSITMIEGSTASNVIPERVRAVGNFRILSGSTIESTVNRIKKLFAGLDIDINILSGKEPSMVSDIDGKGWDSLSEAIVKTWGGSAVIPYLMFAASDARSYYEITPYVYRFSPMEMTEQDRNSIHGIDESITVENYYKIIQFYICLIKSV